MCFYFPPEDSRKQADLNKSLNVEQQQLSPVLAQPKSVFERGERQQQRKIPSIWFPFQTVLDMTNTEKSVSMDFSSAREFTSTFSRIRSGI